MTKDAEDAKLTAWLPIAVSAIALVVSIVAAIIAYQQSQEQLASQRFAAVYDRQLDFSQLLAEHPDVAAFLYQRGARPACDRLTDDAERTEQIQKQQRRCARQDAVLDYAVDFYNYVYWQIREQLPDAR